MLNINEEKTVVASAVTRKTSSSKKTTQGAIVEQEQSTGVDSNRSLPISTGAEQDSIFGIKQEQES